jgi:hypothetical protein
VRSLFYWADKISWSLTRGDCGPAAVSALRGDEILSLMATRVPIGTLDAHNTFETEAGFPKGGSAT